MRIVAGAAGLLPLLLGVGAAPLDMRFFRMGLSLFQWVVGGFQLVWADWVFIAEALALIALALQRQRGRRWWALAWKSIGIGVFFALLGTCGYEACMRGWPPQRFWLLVVRSQPWIALYFIEIAGQLALAVAAAEQLEAGGEAALAFVVILACSAYHDFVLRLFGVVILAALLAGRRGWAVAAALAAAALPAAYRADPQAWRGLASALGLHGGLFALPAFQPALGAGLLAALAFGFWSARRSPGTRKTAGVLAAAAVFALVAVARRPVPPRPASNDLRRMAVWIKTHTDQNALILVSPIDLLDSDTVTGAEAFIAEAQRPVYASNYYVISAMQYGALSAPLAARLAALGLEFRPFKDWNDYRLRLRL
ncbi:MAG: hypothetical protein KGK30_09925, partial [Elusimicrobia bacterium]|nr:hypothetical protein [Elusimicrobiota bacterium]